MTEWQVLCYGPRFLFDINLAAWRSVGPRWRRLVRRDWLFVAAFITLAVITGPRFLLLHLPQ